jgi:16S rRNA (adenine(1408)-N(1))-methyltransferase
LDLHADAMRRSSRVGARPAAKGGLPNALFVVADACELPAELDGLVTQVRASFPWSSLLDGLVGRRPEVLRGLARVCRAGAGVSVQWSIVPRDGVGSRTQTEVRRAWSAAGFTVERCEPASPEELADHPSTWAKRLRVQNGRRTVVALTARRRSR